VQARHPTLVKQLPMDSNSTLPLQKPDCVRHAVLRRNAQAQVDMIGHRVTFHQLDPSLIAGGGFLGLVEDVVVAFLGSVILLCVVRLLTPRRGSRRIGGRA